MECLLPYLCMVTVPHIMVGLERMLDYRGVRLARFHCSGSHNVKYSSWKLAISYALNTLHNVFFSYNPSTLKFLQVHT